MIEVQSLSKKYNWNHVCYLQGGDRSHRRQVRLILRLLASDLLGSEGARWMFEPGIDRAIFWFADHSDRELLEHLFDELELGYRRLL